MTSVAARSKQSLCNRPEKGTFDNSSKAVLWVMTVRVINVAGKAKIIVITRGAGDEVPLRKFYK